MLFVHDHTFLTKDGVFYTTGSLNNKVMSRYREWFGDISVFATTRDIKDTDSVYIKEENSVSNVNFKLVNKKNNIIHIIKNFSLLREEVKKADCVVIRMSIYGSMAAVYAKKFSKPYIVEMVACPWDSLWYHSIKGKILAPFMTLVTRLIVKKASNTLYVTNKFLQKRYPCRGNIIGCSDVELNKIDDKSLELRIKKIKEMKHDKTFKLATVANVGVRYKGQDLVIKAIKELNEEGFNFDYYLIGGGDDTYLKNLVEKLDLNDKVHFIGPVTHEQVFKYINEIDIYIQPSLQEGLPRAVIEAMSKGCPVIGSTTGGIPELINSKYIFKKGQKNDLKRVLSEIKLEDMIGSARENYEKSKQYEKNYLDKKRGEYYKNFALKVRGDKNNG